MARVFVFHARPGPGSEGRRFENAPLYVAAANNLNAFVAEIVPLRFDKLSVPPYATLVRPCTTSLVPFAASNSINVVPKRDNVLLIVSMPMEVPGARVAEPCTVTGPLMVPVPASVELETLTAPPPIDPFTMRVPPPTRVAPVYVFAPPNVSIPVPDLETPMTDPFVELRIAPDIKKFPAPLNTNVRLPTVEPMN